VSVTYFFFYIRKVWPHASTSIAMSERDLYKNYHVLPGMGGDLKKLMRKINKCCLSIKLIPLMTMRCGPQDPIMFCLQTI
jgi:hypothetical protein